MELDYQQLTDGATIIVEQATSYLPKIVGAIATLIIGRRVIKWIVLFTKKAFTKTHLDITVSRFLTSMTSAVLKILLLISVAGMFGIQTTSFIAIIGAAGLAIGMSLQGSLSNFAGGILILLFKPYKVGDLIEIQGVKGHVTEIGVFTTTITTLENNTAIIPNGPVINNNIINYSTKDSIRVDVAVGISYSASIDEAKQVLMQMIRQQDHILEEPAPDILVSKLGDSSVNLIVRAYCFPEHYRATYFTLTEHTKKALDKANISIPFPQRVIHTTTTQV